MEMVYRLVLVLLLGSAASGCFDDSGSTQSTGTSTTSTAASVATPAPHVLILQGEPVTGIAVGDAYTFTPSIASSSTPVTYTISGLPKWASFDAATGTLTGTPSSSDLGLSGDITLTATDGTDTGSVGPFTIRVVAVGVLPQKGMLPAIGGIPLPSAIAGQPYVFQPTATDAMGKPLAYAISNCPPWATFSTVTGRLSGTPSAAEAGGYTHIDIFVSDGTSMAFLPAFSIAVAAGTSDTPLIGGTPPSSVIAGQPYQFSPTASDPDSRALTFSVSNLPPWASFDAASGSLTGTPTASEAGAYPNIVITASNGTSNASLGPFTIDVTTPVSSDTPTISGTPPSSVAAGAAYSFQPSASDPAGKTLTFAIADLPVWAQFDTATGHLTGTPSATEVGSYPNIAISVSNGTASARLATFSIVVSPAAPSAGPSITGTPATSVVVGSNYQFTPTATDSSGAALTFSIQNAPAWATFNAATGELSGTPTTADVRAFANIIISVSDGKTNVSLPAFSISVTQSAESSINLSWTAPTQNANGTALTNLAGYYVYYGTSANQLTQSVRIANPATMSYVVSNLSPGTWYFAIVSFTTANEESTNSVIVSANVD
jgi:hypothetical protein